MNPAAQPPEPADADDAPPLPPMFYVVSTRKFAILFLATAGLYPIYWFYKNWDRYKDRVPAASRFGTTVSPPVRAAFSLFFVHALLRAVKQHGSAHPACRAWATNLHATWLVLLLLAGEGIDVLINATFGPPAGDLAGILVLVVTLFTFLKAQRMINLACDDPAGAANSRLSRANWAWIAIGAIVWAWAFVELLVAK